MARKVITRVVARNGSWYCRIRRKDVDIARSFDLRSVAELWEKQVIAAIDAGTFKRVDWVGEHGEIAKRKAAAKAEALANVNSKPVREITFGEALERYRNTVTTKKKGEREESLKIGKWMRDPLANRRLSDLDSADFASWRDERLEDAKPATVRQYLAIASHVFTIARKEWRIKLENPLDDVAKPTVSNARSRRLTEEEESCLLFAIDNPTVIDGEESPYIDPKIQFNQYIGAIVRFAAESAMRQSEILALEWRHVDLKNRTVTIADSKNGDKFVTIPISPIAAEILKSMQGGARNIHGHVFPTTSRALDQSWKRAIARAKRNYVAECRKTEKILHNAFLEDFRFHDLRHEATSRLFESGLELMEVAAVTRHKDLSMLQRYTHLNAQKLARKMAEKMEKRLGDTDKKSDK